MTHCPQTFIAPTEACIFIEMRNIKVPKLSAWPAKFVMSLILVVATFALYQSCWQNPFVLDDLTKIQQNPDLQVTSFHLENFIFSYPENTTQVHNDPSRPLVYILYWLCWQLAPDSPLLFHILNTTVHAGVAVLVALITTELMLQIFAITSVVAGLVAALLFLSSPLIAGTVVYVYGLSDLLSAFFVLLGYFLLIRPTPETRSRRVLITVAAGLSMLLALATKQSSVVLAPLIFASDLFTRRLTDGKIRRQRWLDVYLPLAVIALAYIVFRFLYFGAVGDLEGRGSTVNPLHYLLFQGSMILKYLKMIFYPNGFTIDHLYIADDIKTYLQILAWLGVLTITGVAIKTAIQSKAKALLRWLSHGWIFFILCLLPTSSFLPTVDMFVERRAYISSIGIFMALGGTLALAFKMPRPLLRALALGVTALALAAQTHLSLARAAVYDSSENLWKESLALDNLNLRARTNLAVQYSASKQYEKARVALEELLNYDPSNGGTYSKLGYVFMQPDYEHHDDNQAWAYMEKSLTILPDNIFALYNGGVILLRNGHAAQAEKLLVHATEVNPLMAAAWLRSGEAALFQQKRADAIIRFRRSLELNANQQDAKMYLKKLGVSEE